MSISISYNGTDLSSFGTTPFISVSQNYIDYKNKWDQITRITLNGQIIADCNESLSSLAKNFVEVFNENYKSFSAGSFSSSCVVIDSVNVEDVDAFNIAPYTVNIDIYDQTLYSNYFGIINPEERVEFTDEENEIISLKYFVSAKGLKTSQNIIPLTNAKNWVKQKINSFNPENTITPVMVKSKDPGSNFILVSRRENIDRFNNSYSCELNYQKSRFAETPANCFLNYSITVDYNIDENFLNATINGSIEKNTINILQSAYNSIDFFNLTSQFVNSTFGGVSLNPKPINTNVNLYENDKKLEFTISYNNDLTPNVINDYTVNIEVDNIKYFTTASINAKISAKYGDQITKWNEVLNFYSSFDGFGLTNAEYKKEVSNKNLNSLPISESINFNEKDAEIIYNASWSDKYKPYSDNILNMSINVTYNPSIDIHIPLTSAFVPREHNIQKINCASFARLEINATATTKPTISIQNALQEASQIMRGISSSYGGSRMIQESYTTSENEQTRTIIINQIWSFEGAVMQ